jgi:hypothetical protein
MTEQEAERLSDRGFDRAPIGNERRGLFVYAQHGHELMG